MMSQNSQNSIRFSRSNLLIERVNRHHSFVKWSDLISGGSKSSLKLQIKAFLEIVSGLDVISLIKDLFSDIETEQIAQNELTALRNIGDVYSSENGKYFKPKDKRNIVKHLKLSGISRNKARKLGN
jgi:hypothetical protein